MTYTIVARCPRTGRVGIGITTYSIAVGLYCNGVRGGTGVAITQAFVNQGNNALALRLLAQGFGAGYVLDALKANDPDADYRQIALVDREGRAAAYTGPRTRAWSGHKVGAGYVATGNVLAGPEVVEAIAAGFEEKPDEDLEWRLLRAIEGGRDAGGQVGGEGHLAERSAALVVHGRGDHPDLDLRVDLHDHAVEELRRIFEAYEPYRAYYAERGRDPRNAVPQEVFVERLKAAGRG
jgi:uncharacterized Ntn-hydrolase superfamily protein